MPVTTYPWGVSGFFAISFSTAFLVEAWEFKVIIERVSSVSGASVK